MDSGVYFTIILAVHILWTVQVEVATGTATNVCGSMRLLSATGLMLTLIVRAKTQHGLGVELMALERDVLAFHPVSSAWVTSYYCWNSLFISALGSPDRIMVNLIGATAMVSGQYVDSNAAHVNT